MERRQPKETDQEETEKAFNLLLGFMAQHPEIEPTLWAGTLWSVLVGGYASSGMPYEQFCRECDRIKEHYKYWFDE